MPSPQSLRRLADLTKKVHDDLRKGGMAVNFRYLFRSTAILARVTSILADHVATQAGAPPSPKDEEVERHPVVDWPNSGGAGDAPESDGKAGG